MLKTKAYAEIKDFKEQIYLGMTSRELICGGLGILCVVGSYFLLSYFLGEDGAGWLCLLAFVPFYFIGFQKKNGQPYEKYLLACLRFYVLGRSKRTFAVENFYESVEKSKAEKQSGKSKTPPRDRKKVI